MTTKTMSPKLQQFVKEVQLWNHSQMNAVIRNKAYLCVDAVTERRFMVAFGGTRNDHYDVTPLTENDARIMEQISGSSDLRQWRARPTYVLIDGIWVALGLCYFMHHIFIGSGRPTPRYRSLNESGPPWTIRGGHCCAYVINSVGGAGNTPNAAVSPEANRLAAQIQSGGRGGQARAAAFEAEIISLRAGFNWGMLEVNITITKPPTTPQQPTQATVHVVSGGSADNTLTKIANMYGTTVPAIMAINPHIANKNIIWQGMRINIPTTTSATPPLSTFREYRVRVNVATSLRVRTGAGNNHPQALNPNGSLMVLQNGATVTVIAESSGTGANLWGRVRNAQGSIIGWIALDFTRRI